MSSSASRLHHTGAIAERVHRASGLPATDPTGRPPPISTPSRSWWSGSSHDQVTISVDSSGAPLWRRGWRLETAKAPLRETLAAALLLAAPWDPTTPLIDPMCGSGTIAIEAALLAAGRAPGRDRPFAFAEWPTFEPGTWASVLEGARRAEAATPPARPPILASDRDAGAVRAAQANAERAGVADSVVVEHHAISDLRPPGDGPTLLLTNPPYGKRVGAAATRATSSPGWAPWPASASRAAASGCSWTPRVRSAPPGCASTNGCARATAASRCASSSGRAGPPAR